MVESDRLANEVFNKDGNGYKYGTNENYPKHTQNMIESGLEDLQQPQNTLEAVDRNQNDLVCNSNTKEGISKDFVRFYNSSSQALEITGIEYTNDGRDLETFMSLPTEYYQYEALRNLSQNGNLGYQPSSNVLPKNSPTAESLLDSTFQSRLRICEENFRDLSTKIFELRPQNYAAFISDCLRDFSHDISLDEFYKLLYCNLAKPAIGKHFKEFDMEECFQNNSKRYSFEKCSFIIETFKLSSIGVSSYHALANNAHLLEVNFQDLRRTFLAIKILFDVIEEVDESLSSCETIPRKSVYEAYYIICQNLTKRFQKHPEVGRTQTNAAVVMSTFGKLTKLVYPNLKLRRLGKRGNSNYHYMGVKWNISNIDSEILNYIKIDGTKSRVSSTGLSQSKGQENEIYGVKTPKINKPDISQISRERDYPVYSFINPSSKFPGGCCLPRIWKCVPGKIPEQSSWSREIISKSMLFLEKYKVNMQPIIESLHQEILSQSDSTNFLTEFVQRMNTLFECDCGSEAYMHLYLIILLLLFPLIVSSDEEVSVEEKVKLRKNLIFFVDSLNTAIPKLSNRERSHFFNFSNIIRKMVHVNDLTSSQVKTGLAKEIMKEIAVDLQKNVGASLDLCEKTASEHIVFRAVVLASKAFKSAFLSHETQEDFTDQKEFMIKVVKSIVKFLFQSTESLSQIPKSISPENLENKTFDLPFQMFRSFAQIFHQVCLIDPFIPKLPIQVINCILLFVQNGMHRASFDNFGKRDHELSKDTFKTWWVHSTLAQEYMQILSEVVGLSEQLL